MSIYDNESFEADMRQEVRRQEREDDKQQLDREARYEDAEQARYDAQEDAQRADRKR